MDPTKTGTLMDSLDASGVKRIDYVVSHHAEQDHSGSIPILATYPQAQVVTNPKCKAMLIDLLHMRRASF